MLEPDLRVYKAYEDYWFFGRPTVENDATTWATCCQRCRPDWDITTASSEQRGREATKMNFYPYGIMEAQVSLHELP